MKCKNCGIEIPDDSGFCFSCGASTKVPVTPEPQMIDAAENMIPAIGTANGVSAPISAKPKKWYAKPWLYIALAAVIAVAVLIVTGIGADIVTFVLEGPSTPISFDSAELEDAVRKQLDIKEDKKITDKDAVGVAELNLEGCGISGIEALAQFKDLTSLNLKSNKVSDLSALTMLQGLKELDLSDNKISDIEALSNLSHLEAVNLSNNQISDIRPLSNLTKIKVIKLNWNLIADINALSGLSNLTDLQLSDNKISDISALAGCGCLTKLSLQNNLIEDISPASKIKALQSIDIRGTKVKDIADVVGKVEIDMDQPEIEISLMPGEYFMIENLKLPIDAGDAEITWTSSDDSVVTVEKDGKIQTTNVHPNAWETSLYGTATLKGKIENVNTEIVCAITIWQDTYHWEWDEKKTTYKYSGWKTTGYACTIDPALENVIGIDLNYDIEITKGKLRKFTLRAYVNGKWKNFGAIDVTKVTEGTVHIEFGSTVKLSRLWLVPKEKKSGQWNDSAYINTVYYALREADLGGLQAGSK